MFKVNISGKGKTYHFEYDGEAVIGRKIGEIVDGTDFRDDFSGYVFKITGASDKAGFPYYTALEGQGLHHVLVSYKKGKKVKQNKRLKPRGVRLRKTMRGNTISPDTMQINLIVEKEGTKKLAEIFPEQNKPKEKKAPQEVKAEEKKEDKTELKEAKSEEVSAQ
ncbi:30S ribosomal protein S6e [Candidatus Pacearchaeota archaeon]|nr:30S ribosomal protein S6e [Candidatus Pacearchaeota archaeon]